MSLLEDNDKLKLAKAVLNHTKTVANEYIEKHAKSTTAVNGIDINKDKFYEMAMLEIEENNKIRSTWARALTQTDGDKEKLEPTYIKLRVAELVQEEKERIIFHQEYERAKKIKEEEKRELEEKKKKIAKEVAKNNLSNEELKKWFEKQEKEKIENDKLLMEHKEEDKTFIYIFIFIILIFIFILIISK